MDPNIEAYFENVGKWQKELVQLRSIVLDCGLEEAYKWMHPCYTHKNANVLVIHEFKDFCAISFFKGVLLKDEYKLLIKPTENMQAGRQIRFTNVEDIVNIETKIRSYIFEAIEVEKSGLKVMMKKTSDFEVPEELEQKFIASAAFKSAWNNLTPGRQRGYLLHFAQPKQSKTRTLRIEKNVDRILDGIGLRDCICGLSKRMPNCDGSHKTQHQM